MALEPGDLHHGTKGQQKQGGGQVGRLEQKPFVIPAMRLHDTHIGRQISNVTTALFRQVRPVIKHHTQVRTFLMTDKGAGERGSCGQNKNKSALPERADFCAWSFCPASNLLFAEPPTGVKGRSTVFASLTYGPSPASRTPLDQAFGHANILKRCFVDQLDQWQMFSLT